MSDLFSGYSGWYRSLERSWCMRHDAKYRDLETRREDGAMDGTTIFLSDEHGLGMDEWHYQQGVERRVQHRFPYNVLFLPYHVHWWLEKHGVQVNIRRWKTFWHRGKKGYAPSDVWGLHSYLAKVIRNSVLDLRIHSHGHPSQLTPQEWEDVLGKIVLGFEAAQTMEESLVISAYPPELQQAFDEGFELLRKWWFHLWD